jgi:hypothetical protein
MALIAEKYTLQHLATVTKPDGALLDVFDNISEINDLMKVMQYFPTNEVSRNVTAQVTAYGTPSAVIANEGRTEIINTHEQIVDVPIRFHNIITPDEEVLKRASSPGQWRADRVREYAQSYGQAVASQIITGDASTDPGKAIDGLAKRLGSLPASATDVTDPFFTVVAGGGSGADNTSIYIVGIGKNGLHGLYGMNGTAGFQFKMRPSQLVAASIGSGNIPTTPIDVSWEIGLCSSNRRAIGRICNIDVSDLTDDASAGANLVNLLVHAINKTRVHEMGLTPVLLANENVISYFETQRINHGSNAGATGQMTDLGKVLTTFKGIPFLRMDSIPNNEA